MLVSSCVITNTIITITATKEDALVKCQTCNREVASLNINCASVYQRQLSVPSLRGRLMSTSESWGVNGHTTRWSGHLLTFLQLRLRATKTEISATPWTLEALEELYFLHDFFTTIETVYQHVKNADYCCNHTDNGDSW